MLSAILARFGLRLPKPPVVKTEEETFMDILQNFDTSGYSVVHSPEYATIPISSHYKNIVMHARSLSILATKMSEGIPVTSLELGVAQDTFNLSDYFIDNGVYIDEGRAVTQFIRGCVRFFTFSSDYCKDLSNDRKSRVAIEIIAAETKELVNILLEI